MLRALLDREPAMSPARVAGWRAVRLRGRPYPALVPSANSHDCAEGLLLEGIESDEWRILDDFEDDIYDLLPLGLLDGRTGWAYVCQDGDLASGDAWDINAFAQHELASYVERCLAWRAGSTSAGHTREWATTERPGCNLTSPRTGNAT